MKDAARKLNVLYWTPRILGMFFICFLAIFALDVFVPGKSIGYYLIALFMHLLPNFILLGLLLVAWKYERIGGTIFLIIGVFFTYFFKTYEHVINVVVISCPLFLIGLLFLLHDYSLKKGRL